MKKYYQFSPYRILVGLITVLAIFAPVAGRAETVSQKEASKIAHAFFNQAAGQVMGAPKMVYNGRRLTTERLFVPFYVYNNPAGGFVIISAENKAFPILGYSLKESFDPDHIGDKEKALLTGYARDIEYIRFDSRVPEQAIAAWGNIPGYIASVLDARSEVTDPAYDMEEAAETIDRLADSPVIDRFSSDMFTPDQWKEMVDEEFGARRSVILGLVSGQRLLPVIVHGHSGDYYRIQLDNRNQWMMRLMATEFLSDGQVAMLSDPLPIPEEEEEAVPFAFYDDILAGMKAEEAARSLQLDELLHPSEPQLKAIGAGRFEISFPENVVLARVYNLDGSMIERYTFRDTNIGHVDISGHPNGFYFVLFNGESGTPYGLKLFR